MDFITERGHFSKDIVPWGQSGKGLSIRCLLFFFLVMILAISLTWAGSGLFAEPPSPGRTFCNPIDLDLRAVSSADMKTAGVRHAADPAVVCFHDRYYLFITFDIRGCRVSDDLIHWRPLPFSESTVKKVAEIYGGEVPDDFNLAPAAAVRDGYLYFVPSGHRNPTAILRTDNPESSEWEVFRLPNDVVDDALFFDQDGKSYLYYGASGNPFANLFVSELDLGAMELVADSKKNLRIKPKTPDGFYEGIERTAPKTPRDELFPVAWKNLVGYPWEEGAWMTRHKDRYYLQYAAPGTEYPWYSDLVMEGKTVIGPFQEVDYGPASMKMGGFISGAGHSAVFQDKFGNYWRASTMWIGVQHKFERRVGIFPVGFDDLGRMLTDTAYGDWPIEVPRSWVGTKSTRLHPTWNLLSFGGHTTASSTAPGSCPESACDENVRSIWSAATGKSGEWFQIDLGHTGSVAAVQINFADVEIDPSRADEGEDFHAWRLWFSDNGTDWEIAADRSENRTATPNAYEEWGDPLRARFIRLENVHSPLSGRFALSDLRVFGRGDGPVPGRVADFTVRRDPDDIRNAVLRWTPVENADGYLIRFGYGEEALHLSLQVQGGETSETITHVLNKNPNVRFTIEAFNGNGVGERTAAAVSTDGT